MNEVSHGPTHDLKLAPLSVPVPAPQSPDMNAELKRPVHIGEDSDQVPPVAKRFKSLDGAVSQTLPLAPHAAADAKEQEPNSQQTTASNGDTSVCTPSKLAGSQASTSTCTSVPPVVSPKESSRQVPTSGMSSFSSSSSSASSEGGLLQSSSRTMTTTATATTTTTSTEDAAVVTPLQAIKMSHLRDKYYAELEYMLREFRKLERQLLGAKGNGTGIEESSGSRERREKLHSFILHLEDTIRQIDVGCQVESGGEVAGAAAAGASSGDGQDQQGRDSAPGSTTASKEKDDEENVKKLEEHILANLLPVKVRLKKQLAAQQGATRNPIGMPVATRGLQPSMMMTAEKGKGTFAAAAEEKRRQAEAARLAAQERALASPPAPSQFGKPLIGAGSSLTRNLHGPTLGSQARKHGHGVGSEKPPVPDPTAIKGLPDGAIETPKRPILYAGMALGSEQHHSGVSAAAGVHSMVFDEPCLKPTVEQVTTTEVTSSQMPPTTHHPVPRLEELKSCKPHEDPKLSDELRKKLHKDRRRRKKHRELERREKERQRQLFLQQQQQQQNAAQVTAVAPKGSGKKGGMVGSKPAGSQTKGPRTVEYICALCSEAYSSTCDFNPWWALASHDCPKCRKNQIPRIDITAPVNAIEYHPALLAHAEEGPNGGGGMEASPSPVVIQPIPSNSAYPLTPQSSKLPTLYPLSDSDDESDLSELSDAANLSDDSYDSDDSEDDMPLTEGELAEMENFGKEYEGPKLTPDQASRLLILMGHAQTCPGRHVSESHRDCCNSVKFMMLHVRDCPGTTSTLDVCPFPWCRKVKHLMYHLVACPRPRDCAICSPIALSKNLKALIGLTNHRRTMQRERAKAAMAAAAAAKAKPPAPKMSYAPKAPKPVTYRPPQKKATVPVKVNKPAVAKPVVPSVPPQRVAPPPAARPGTNMVVGKAPPVVKPTNGVVVKSLIKPAGRSVVVLKSRPPQRPALGEPGKPVVASLPGAKPTVLPLPGVGDLAPLGAPSLSFSLDNTDPAPSLPALVPIPLKTEGKAHSSDTPSSETGTEKSEIAVPTQTQFTVETTPTDTEATPFIALEPLPAADVDITLETEETSFGYVCEPSESSMPIPVAINKEDTPSGDALHEYTSSLKTQDQCDEGRGDMQPSSTSSVITASDVSTVTTKIDERGVPDGADQTSVGDQSKESPSSGLSAPVEVRLPAAELEAKGSVEAAPAMFPEPATMLPLPAAPLDIALPTVEPSAITASMNVPLAEHGETSLAAQHDKLDADMGSFAMEDAELGVNASLVESAMPGQLQVTLEQSATPSAEFDLSRTNASQERRTSPPRFPDVPVIVNQEDGDDDSRNNQEAPHEVPPV
ncbi:hypothetical protein MHU86_8837 [Fragilaria crotonensis]|nr:hypothetical protein MHU86_8837 [Fragilaria crotonensis]